MSGAAFANGLACTRRGALALIAMGAGAAALAPLPLRAGGSGAARFAPARSSPAMSYFVDGLIRDPSGQLAPYRAPGGFRGGRALQRMDDRALAMAGLRI